MPRSRWASSSTRGTAQHKYSPFLVPSRLSFTHSASRTPRVNRGNDTGSIPNKSHNDSQSHGSKTLFPSAMTSRTLSSGQMLIYLRDTALTDQTVEKFREKLSGPLGFDIEYRPNFVKGRPLNKTALVQLASSSVILLVQVSAMSSQYPQP